MKKPSPKAQPTHRPKWREKEDILSLLEVPEGLLIPATIWETRRHIALAGYKASTGGEFRSCYSIWHILRNATGSRPSWNRAWSELPDGEISNLEAAYGTLSREWRRCIWTTEELRQEAKDSPVPWLYNRRHPRNPSQPTVEDIELRIDWTAGIHALKRSFKEWLQENAPRGTPGTPGNKDPKHGRGIWKTAHFRGTLVWLACVRHKDNGKSHDSICDWLKSNGQSNSKTFVEKSRGKLDDRLKEWFGAVF